MTTSEKVAYLKGLAEGMGIQDLKLNGLGVIVIRHAADAILPHSLIWDSVLNGMRPFPAFLLISGHQFL